MSARLRFRIGPDSTNIWRIRGLCLRCGTWPAVRGCPVIPPALAGGGGGQTAEAGPTTEAAAHAPAPPSWAIATEAPLLCQPCLDRLAPLDEMGARFVRVARVASASAGHDPEWIEIAADAGCDSVEVTRFCLSVLWRACLARGRAFQDLDLWPHRESIKSWVFGEVGAAPPPGVAAWAFDLTDGAGGPMPELTAAPRACRVGRVRCWSMILHGIAFLIKRDHRRLPDAFEEFRLAADTPIRLLRLPYEGSIFSHGDPAAPANEGGAGRASGSEASLAS
jgi:hypothetical protein